ncbi:sigma-54-dependent Fis family transcriptional regulator [Steroidobacter flavus]|uniref:Sigma-54-dependent Fis family transcriptional regulator n=1 Tax=Steroidobacter flavus TaxID=1842136 RepID=A0ABV8SXR0_9GAMM
MTTVQHHVDRILRVVHAHEPLATLDANTSLIHRSWRRCATEHALDPGLRPDVRIETSSRLRECLQQNEEHLHVARAGMEQLYKHVSALGYVLLLTDADGVTIDYIGNDTWDQSLKRAGLALGANWNEIHAGTNGIGTCIAEQATLTCHREDHYYVGHVGLSCTSTPLFDPLGGFMGALDVSVLSSPDVRESQHLIRHLTRLYGRMIEDANFMHQFREHWILRLGTAGPLVDVCGELMLALDRDGKIVGANADARRNLRLLETTHIPSEMRGNLVGHHLSGVFGSRIDDIWRLTKGTASDERIIVTTWEGQGYHAAMIAPKAAPSRYRTVESGAQPNPRREQILQRLAGEDHRMQQLLDRAARLVDKPVNILIQGETGTGKEVLARALHDSSRRADQPFIAVNCAAIPESLIESELFGYMPGTFTGARSKGMKGLIQRADGGTLFLDEIGDMPLQLQTRLLRTLSEREILPLGADRPVHVNLHVIAASHRDLRRQIGAGTFREDLYYRLCGATLALPALRERTDKEFLITRILRAEASTMQTEASISDAALALLLRHEWPGNVREMRNVLCFALSLAEGEPIEIRHLPQEIVDLASSGSEPAAALALPAPVRAASLESAAADSANELLEALRRHHWNITETAKELGLCRATIYRRMKRHDIVPPTQFS